MDGQQEQHDLEQWDIVSSVGYTALMVAAGRAVETNDPHGLVDDPHAEFFVERARITPRLPTRPEQPWPIAADSGMTRGQVDAFWSLMSSYQGVRSRFFDQSLAGTVALGADQVVLLAAGLDTRAYRLDWPAGTVVYEIDQPQVLAFKKQALVERRAEPRCVHRQVPCDLRADWASALLAAGFQPGRRTAWLAEGLLPFLPDRAEQELFDAVTRLSGPGSTVSAEHFLDTLTAAESRTMIAALGQPYGVDITSLIHPDGRAHPADRLGSLGWRVDTHDAMALARDYGRALDTAGVVFSNGLIHATLRDGLRDGT